MKIFFRYTEHLQEKSFIHVDDFKNPEDLATYINYISQNSTELFGHMSWRLYYKKTCNNDSLFCRLCAKLHSHKEKVADGTITNSQYLIKDFPSFWAQKPCKYLEPSLIVPSYD